MKNFPAAVCFIAIVCSVSSAQNPSTTSQGVAEQTQQGGQPSGPGQIPGQAPNQGPGQAGGPVGTPANAEQIAKLLMRGDKDSDGKLSPEEIPPQIKERFASIDINKDGLIDQEELVAFAKTQDRSGGVRRGQGQNFEGAMKQIERGLKELEKSPLDAGSRAKDLANVQMIEAGLVNSKGQISTVRMAPQAKAKYGEDTAKYELDMRMQLLAALTRAIELENAILRGDSAAAKELVGKLESEEEEGHEMFMQEKKEGNGGEKEGSSKGNEASGGSTSAPK